VLTAFAGVDNGRKTLARHSHFALEQRAPIDVAITRTGWAIDPNEGAAAIPWIAGPFSLRVSSTRDASVAVTVKIRRPLHDRPTLQFADSKGRPQATARSADGSTFCTTTRVRNGQALLGAQPTFDQPPPVGTQMTESDPLPPPPKAIGIASVRARLGDCPAAFIRGPKAVVYGEGWFASEPEASGRYRWMGTAATISIGEPGRERKAVTLATTAISLIAPRVLTVTLDGEVIARLTVPANAVLPVSIHVPAGTGTARLSLRTTPGAAPASQVTPGDTRVVSIRLRDFAP
jgi:hypothetical protein